MEFGQENFTTLSNVIQDLSGHLTASYHDLVMKAVLT
jgi:hypothetical protein